MTKMKKKFTRGEATTFVSRKQALKRLQLSLNDFKRLCILKGVYPQEPRNRRKVGRGSSQPKVYYHLKDVQFLGHEPVMQKLRDIKAHLKKAKRAKERGDLESVGRLQRAFPTYTLDHIIRERYPSFEDAVRDLDDCLCLCFLFARLPKVRGVLVEQIELSQRLTVQFLHWVMESRSLRKAFVSIKGYYFEADVMGVPVVWTVPHQLGLHNPADVDFRVLKTFNEFYTTLLGFVNFRLYKTLGLVYPPALMGEADSGDYCRSGEASDEFMASLNQPLMSRRGADEFEESQADEDADEFDVEDAETDPQTAECRAALLKSRSQRRLFAGCRFFLNRETPRQLLCFVIRSCGGSVSWSASCGPGARYPESDPAITHQVIDRQLGDSRSLSRLYVQPQFVFDCLNAGRLLPAGEYAPGCVPPPHLSPFVGDEYQPAAGAQAGVELHRLADDAVESKDVVEDVEEADEAKEAPSVVTEGAVKRPRDPKQLAAEERRLREMMLPKKHRMLYNKMVFAKKRRAREAGRLAEKRAKRMRGGDGQ